MAKITGFRDIPAQEDLFNIQNYIDGLSAFIRDCETPMTLAIQGDWGTGKSSIMEMVAAKINAENKRGLYSLVSFNTWQFSQFNLGDQLPVVLLSRLLREVSGEDEKTAATTETIKRALFKLSSSIVRTVTKDIVDLENLKPEDTTDLIEQIGKLKDNFQELIDKKAGEKGRVIIFVDDLDRLDPARAVELLEVLKIFLDCNKCVFVLAIDYGVVARGVKAKYGGDFNDEKAKSFFDKIIQVPFKMPVSKYKIETFVKQHFQNMGIKINKPADLKVYMDFIGHSIGNNPRSMKRLFNSFQLLSFVTKDAQDLDGSDKTSKERDTQKLFALLCMQSSFEKLYNYIVEHQNDISEPFLRELKEGTSPVYDGKITEKEKVRAVQFFNDFYEMMDDDGNGELDQKELFGLLKVLNYSTMTSASAEAASESDSKLEFKTMLTPIVSAVQKDVLNKTGLELKMYSSSGADYGNIKLQKWVVKEREGNKSNSNLFLEFRFIKTDILEGAVKGFHMDVALWCGGYSETEIKKYVNSNPLKDVKGLPSSNLRTGKNSLVYENVFVLHDIYGKTSNDVKKISEIAIAAADAVKEYFNEGEN